MMTRRQAIKTSTLAAIAAAAAPNVVGQGFTDFELRALVGGSYPFELPSLPYGLDALEPYIGAPTLEVHHGHSAAVANQWHFTGQSSLQFSHGIAGNYVLNLNKALSQDLNFYYLWANGNRSENGAYRTKPWLEGMLRDLNSIPVKIRTAIRNNGGGHSNHSLFWQMMKKNGGGEPKNELAKSIEKSFGSFRAFKEEFSDAAVKLFGSGWAWLTLEGKELRIETTPNEDSPLSAGREVLLGIDVWEHAYYLQYQNKRADYVAAWWNVVNWDFVAERYAKLTA